MPNKKWCEENPKRYREYQQGWIRTHPNYFRDYRRGNIITTGGKMVKVNKRPRPNDICEVCNNKVVRLEYHHWDSNHPCLGLWLCCGCHRMAERVDKGLHTNYLQEKEEMILVE